MGKAEVEEPIRSLTAANSFLAEEERIKRAIAEETEKTRLMTELETEISGHTARLSSMIEQLDSAASQPKDTVVLCLLLCYVKRQSSLFFREREADVIPIDEFMVYLDELADIASYADLKIILTGEIKKPISVRKARLFYGFFYNAVDWALSGCCPSIIAHLRAENGSISMRLLPFTDARTFAPDTELSPAIAVEGGAIALTDYDDAYGISLSFPEGGEEDVTKRWALTEQLRQQETELKLRGDELKDTIANLHFLSREKELQDTKLRTHDILGGWLTMLLHAIRNEQAIDLDMLRIQSRSLPHNLITGHGAATPLDKLNSLRRSFETIGVEIHLDGDLPGDEVKGHLLMDVIGEGVINAVRHAFATKVSVRIMHSHDGWHLEVTDNGSAPVQPIIEGGGIGGVRKKLEPHGGVLKVTADPRFVLTVDLPGDEKDG